MEPLQLQNIQKVKQTIGDALGIMQTDQSLPPDIAEIVQNLALGVEQLFEAENAKDWKKSKGHVVQALSWLSQTLALLQQVDTPSAGVGKATELIAQSVSTLYPMARETTRRSLLPVDEQVELTKGPRHPLEVNIGVATESNFYVGFSGDIAEGGVFCATYNVLGEGTPIALHITLPGGFDIQAKGFVRFVRDHADGTEPGVGIQFDRLAKEAKDLILRFIRKRPPMFYDD